MRILMTACMLALLAGQALAQAPGSGANGGYRAPFANRNQEQKAGPPPKVIANDKDYQSALKGIPDKKEKVDPWSGVTR
jgi:hypothetical protein